VHDAPRGAHSGTPRFHFIETEEEEITMTTLNRPTQQDRDRKTLAAIQKYLMQMTAITIAGVTQTPQQLIQQFQTYMQTADAATQARATFLSAAATARTTQTASRPFRRGFRSFIENTFADPSILAEFGLPPHKTATVTVDTKAAAAAKSLATRKARHTLGKQQKKAIHGTVPATAPAEVGAPAPSTAPPVATPAAIAAKTVS
jgi:hypothetical protein